MPGIGANGSVTTFPANGEKVCAGCEYWRGVREVTYSGSCATTPNGQAARCVKKNGNTLPNSPCLCSPQCFQKWNELK